MRTSHEVGLKGNKKLGWFTPIIFVTLLYQRIYYARSLILEFTSYIVGKIGDCQHYEHESKEKKILVEHFFFSYYMSMPYLQP